MLINFEIGDRFIEVEAQVDTVDRTGVEMEALTACAIAALTIYDMCKSSDRTMEIGDLTLWRRRAGARVPTAALTPNPTASCDGGHAGDGLGLLNCRRPFASVSLRSRIDISVVGL